MRPGTLSLGLGALLLLLGLGGTALSGFSGFSLVYVLVAALGVAPLALGLVARRRARGGALLDALGVVCVVVPVGTWVVGTDVERDWSHAVSWSIAELPGRDDGARYVRLEFADFPGRVAGLPLEPWAERLRGREGETLALATRSTADFGRVRAVRALALDGEPVGDDGLLFLGTSGPSPAPSPWGGEARVTPGGSR